MRRDASRRVARHGRALGAAHRARARANESRDVVVPRERVATLG